MQQNQNDNRPGNPNQGDANRRQDANATSDQPAGPGRGQSAPMSPGDEAPAGTPGTGENVCSCCGGSGRMAGGKECAECGGTGKVTVGIGGA